MESSVNSIVREREEMTGEMQSWSSRFQGNEEAAGSGKDEEKEIERIDD